jgi:hypothetical protein
VDSCEGVDVGGEFREKKKISVMSSAVLYLGVGKAGRWDGGGKDGIKVDRKRVECNKQGKESKRKTHESPTPPRPPARTPPPRRRAAAMSSAFVSRRRRRMVRGGWLDCRLIAFASKCEVQVRQVEVKTTGRVKEDNGG